jgi:hypothetical protein
MPCWTHRPWPHNLNQTVSGKAGAVQTSSCIMHSTCGWADSSLTCHGVVTRMMDWCIAGARVKRGSSEKRSQLVFWNAAWKCIPRKRKLSTAKMIDGGVGTRPSNLTFSGIAFVRDLSRVQLRRKRFADLPRPSAHQR